MPRVNERPTDSTKKRALRWKMAAGGNERNQTQLLENKCQIRGDSPCLSPQPLEVAVDIALGEDAQVVGVFWRVGKCFLNGVRAVLFVRIVAAIVAQVAEQLLGNAALKIRYCCNISYCRIQITCQSKLHFV